MIKNTTKSPGKKQKEKKYRLTTWNAFTLQRPPMLPAALSSWQTALPRCLHQTAKYGPDLHLQLQQSTAWQSTATGVSNTTALVARRHPLMYEYSLNTRQDIPGATNLFFFLDNNSTQSQTYEMWFGTRGETSMWIFHICFHKKTVIMNSTLVHPEASWSVRPSSPTGDRQQGSRVFHSSVTPTILPLITSLWTPQKKEKNLKWVSLGADVQRVHGNILYSSNP